MLIAAVTVSTFSITWQTSFAVHETILSPNEILRILIFFCSDITFAILFHVHNSKQTCDFQNVD